MISRIIKRKNRNQLLDELFGNNSEGDNLLVDCPSFDLGLYWSEAITVGACTQYLCNITNNKNYNSQAYFAGTFHNIGLIALVYLYPLEMTQIRAKLTSIEHQLCLEKIQFGIDHTNFGANILKQWKVCDTITTAAKYSEYSLDETAGSTLTQIVSQAIEWRRSRFNKLTFLGKRLNNSEYKQLTQEEQRINDLSGIFAYEKL